MGDSGKRAKIVDEVPLMRPGHRALKPPNPTVALQGHADANLEELDERFGAHFCRCRDRGNARDEWRSVEGSQRKTRRPHASLAVSTSPGEWPRGHRAASRRCDS